MKKLFINGHIFTSCEGQPFTEVMLVEDGQIRWIGTQDEWDDQTKEHPETTVEEQEEACSAKQPETSLKEPARGSTGIYDDDDSGMEIIDLKGRTVIPGFVDAHMHPVMLAEYSRQIPCLPPKICSIEDLIREIARAREDLLDQHSDAGETAAAARAIDAGETAAAARAIDAGETGAAARAIDAGETDTAARAIDAGETSAATGTSVPKDAGTAGGCGGALPWIRGWGYDEGKYAEKRSPNRYDLDRGCADLPVLLKRCCEHILCVNSRALEIAGITKDTPDPPGGSIDRDESGEPTGILRESARDLILPYVPADTFDDTVAALMDLGRLLLSQGIVAIADMGNLHPGGSLELLEAAVKKGFQQRAALYYMWDYFKDEPAFAVSEEQMDPKRQIRIAGLKLIGDGSISGRTAWLREPYEGSDDCGMPVYADEDLESAIRFAKKCGCQISVHAMGGRAIDRVIKRMSKEEDWMPGRAPYLRVEHVTEPSMRAIGMAVRHGFAFVSQPIFEYCEIETYRANMDEARLRQLYPYQSMLDRGVKLAFSTDAPATAWAVPSDPFSNLKSAVTRLAVDGTDTGQDECVDIETAVALYTKEAAEVCGFEDLGQIASGYAADFAVLSDDLFSIDPMRIDEIRVEETWIGGRRVYRRSE